MANDRSHPRSRTIPILIGCYLLFRGYHLGYPFNVGIIPHTKPILIAAAILCICGLAFCFWARAVLGGNWSGTYSSGLGIEVTKILGESGIYSKGHYWEFFVDNHAASLGICSQKVTSGDQLLFANVSAGVPYGKRYGTAGEGANLVMWLLSDESEYVSGALHLIDGALNAG